MAFFGKISQRGKKTQPQGTSRDPAVVPPVKKKTYIHSFPEQKGHITDTPYHVTLQSAADLSAVTTKSNTSYAIPINDGKKTHYKYKEGHQDPNTIKYVQAEWDKKRAQNPNIFNGDLLTITQRLTPRSDDNNGMSYPLKVHHNDFATVSASRNTNKSTTLPLRDHFTSGVIIVPVTKDGHIIFGSRGGKDAQYAQFPGGFIGGNQNIPTDDLLDRVSQSPTALGEIIEETAMKEGQEEIFKSFKGKAEYVGHIGKVFTHPSTSTKDGTKKVLSVKSFVCVVKSDKTLAEIQKERKETPPQDIHEMEILSSIPLADVGKMAPTSKLAVGGKKLPFVAEHGHVLDLLKKHLEKVQMS